MICPPLTNDVYFICLAYPLISRPVYAKHTSPPQLPQLDPYRLPTNKGGMVTLGYPLLEPGYLEVTRGSGNPTGLPKVTLRLP